GRHAFVVPLGGSSPLGASAYATAADEIVSQLGHDDVLVVTATGSGGTQAGLAARLGHDRVLGIDAGALPIRPRLFDDSRSWWPTCLGLTLLPASRDSYEIRSGKDMARPRTRASRRSASPLAPRDCSSTPCTPGRRWPG